MSWCFCLIYQLKAKASDFVKNVSEGTVYCAKFSVDGNWYRYRAM